MGKLMGKEVFLQLELGMRMECGLSQLQWKGSPEEAASK